MAHSERIHTGVLHGCSENAHRRVFLVNETSEDSCESEVEYPLTPPLSESSGSRSHSPEHATFPADLNIITMVHLSRLRKRRNVAVRRQPKSMFHPVHLVGYLIGVRERCILRIQQVDTSRGVPCFRETRHCLSQPLAVAKLC
jgi:hypothetical protein